MNDSTAKQQIVDKIKDSSNILVTVSTNPSVDELSAALGLTVLLNKMNKHATAVFSGAIPPAITFLDPQKTFENTVDSLRDFIIALDKEKADHLRYKVDGDVVKIFITPYRTTITSDDLDFSQGDYNVELVLALGVKHSESLDAALEAHGRILHDATVVSIAMGEEKSDLGGIEWREQNVSSLSEMVVALTDAIKSDKKLIDEQVATAFLTGIVAATDRFSNSRTSSRVMTVAAQLMAAGANQQLIATKLEEADEIGGGAPPKSSQNSDGTTDLSEGKSTKVNKQPATPKLPKQPTAEPVKKKEDDGSLVISHEKVGDVDEVAAQTEKERQEAAAKAAQEELDRAAEVKRQEEVKKAEAELANQVGATLPPVAVPGTSPSVADLQKDLQQANAEMNQAAEQAPASTATTWQDAQPPSMGGTLNATTEQAAEDKRRAMEDDRNRTILTHGNAGGSGYVGDHQSQPAFQSPLNAAMQPTPDETPVDPFAQLAPPAEELTAPTAYASPVQPPATPPANETLADLDRQNRVPHEDARAAVDAAFNAAPEVATSPQSPFPSFDQPAPATSGSTTLPPLPDFSTLPPPPPLPDFSAQAPSGPLPPDKLEDVLEPAPAPAAPPQSTDPSQFRIPGQP
ncbi:hypothetical protein PV379_03095 [Streptomyces caniscabiei]|uniref:DHH family phosphoesterase n=1 Tax=Streptomyces caniscabiei TaxID=2746961 RepID=UPI0029A38196|nr:hypothetical protein [Streptomyces caniscabiei]MDX2776330.1 hypothetical protein [Streptomyces caniscabiei]